MTVHPRVSIVINTDGRAESLAVTLDSLRWLEGQEFEVCVVTGPTRDGTDALLEKWTGAVKTASCPERNLSMSRNIGIWLAAGEIVAFLDDDAIPEPEWLRELTVPYRDARTGAAGGFVFGPDGVEYQYRLATGNRLGGTDHSWQRPAPELCFPFTAHYPHLLYHLLEGLTQFGACPTRRRFDSRWRTDEVRHDDAAAG